jgi:hypothetical protein
MQQNNHIRRDAQNGKHWPTNGSGVTRPSTNIFGRLLSRRLDVSAATARS